MFFVTLEGAHLASSKKKPGISLQEQEQGTGRKSFQCTYHYFNILHPCWVSFSTESRASISALLCMSASANVHLFIQSQHHAVIESMQ